MEKLNDKALNLLFREAPRQMSGSTGRLATILSVDCVTLLNGVPRARIRSPLALSLFVRRKLRGDSGQHCHRRM